MCSLAPCKLQLSFSCDPSSSTLSVEQRISEAANTGILDLRGCASPDALHAAKEDLQAVYVADLRSSRWADRGAAVLALPLYMVCAVTCLPGNQCSSQKHAPQASC